jgi:hypothetical protein
MELNLKYPPVPANAPKFAVDITAAAAKISGVQLDYSVASLQAVDDIIEGLRRDGCTSSQVGETLFGFGCYVGEVFVRHAGGRWRSGKESAHGVFHDAPLMVELANGKWCNPVGKVFKRLDAGAENSLPYFYRVFAIEA